MSKLHNNQRPQIESNNPSTFQIYKCTINNLKLSALSSRNHTGTFDYPFLSTQNLCTHETSPYQSMSYRSTCYQLTTPNINKVKLSQRTFRKSKMNQTEVKIKKHNKIFNFLTERERLNRKKEKASLLIQNFYEKSKEKYIINKTQMQRNIHNNIYEMNKKIQSVQTMCDYIFPYVRRAKETKRLMIKKKEKDYQLKKQNIKRKINENFVMLTENNNSNHFSKKANSTVGFKRINNKDYLQVNSLYRYQIKK